MTEWPQKKFQFVAGELCLDFCNTVGGKRGAVTREYLHSYKDLASWAEQAGLMPMAAARGLASEATAHPVEGDEVLSRAVELREALYRMFVAFSQGKAPSKADLALLNSELARTLGRLRLAPIDGQHRFAWQWKNDAHALDAPLCPVARSAAELLTCEPRLHLVHRCEGDTCGWLFLDCSKNHSRRWCDMRDCGNRAKVRRHRMKQRGCGE